MQMDKQRLERIVPGTKDVRRIARPESVVLLVENVRAALEVRGDRVDCLKERVSDGGYAVPSNQVARDVLKLLNPPA